MGKQGTTSHDVNELEFRLNCSHSFFSKRAFGKMGNNFNSKNIINITRKVFVAICPIRKVRYAQRVEMRNGTHETSFCQSASVTDGLTSCECSLRSVGV